MLLNKFDKEKILDNIVVSKYQTGKTIHLNWKAGKLSYILDMKAIWTKAQQTYLDDRFGKVESRLNSIEARLDVLEKDMADVKSTLKLIIEILARNGMK